MKLGPVHISFRDALPAPVRMIGFSLDGGLLPGGVTGTTALGISAVWRSLDILANGVSQLEWHERRGNLDLPPSRLVDRPDSRYTRREWVSLVVSTLALYDVCYLLKVGGTDSEGIPIGLWYMQPGTVTPFTSDQFSLLPPDEFFVGNDRVPRDQLVILRRSPQPGIDDTLGGVIRLARTSFATAISAENYASRFWQSGGATNVVLETEAKLSESEATNLGDRFAAKRARGPDYVPVLDTGLKAKDLGADITAQSAVEARKELVADVGRYFGIPTHTLNAPAGDSETYSSTEAGNQDLVRYTLSNYLGAIQDGVSDQLPRGRHMVMDPRRLLDGTMYSRMQGYQLATGAKAWMTPDEVRDQLGLPPIEDPDELNPPPPAPVVVEAPAGGMPDGR